MKVALALEGLSTTIKQIMEKENQRNPNLVLKWIYIIN